MQITHFIGVDVAKQSLSIAAHNNSLASQTVANNKTAIKIFLSTLPPQSAIAVEATNTFHRLLTTLALQAHFTVYVLNPHDVHHYCRAVGQRAKTDRVDAQLIARYLAKEHPELHPWTPPSTVQTAIFTLITRRAAVTKAKQALQQSLSDVPITKPILRTLTRQLAKAQSAIDKAIVAQLKLDPNLAETAKKLRDIPGVGPLISTALATLLQRFSFVNADAVTCYVGLDPRAKDSGQKRGQRKLTKHGPAELRRLLYLAAMTAARHPAIKAFHERQLAKGLSCIAAYNVLARKLLRTAWSLVKHDQTFDLNRLVNQLT